MHVARAKDSLNILQLEQAAAGNQEPEGDEATARKHQDARSKHVQNTPHGANPNLKQRVVSQHVTRVYGRSHRVVPLQVPATLRLFARQLGPRPCVGGSCQRDAMGPGMHWRSTRTTRASGPLSASRPEGRPQTGRQSCGCSVPRSRPPSCSASPARTLPQACGISAVPAPSLA